MKFQIGKKCVIFVLGVSLLFSPCYAFSQALFSPWAEESLEFAKACGVLTEEETLWDYCSPITRGELVPLLLRSYQIATKNVVPKSPKNVFYDASRDATSVYLLGIMNGVGNDKFAPEANVTREQISKIILTLQSVCEDRELQLPEAYYNPLTDFMAVSDWAKPYVEAAYNSGMITGYEDGSFRGGNTVSKEEAVVLLLRSVSFDNTEPKEETETTVSKTEETAFSDTLSWNVKSSYESGELTVTWNRIKEAEEYHLTVWEQRHSRYEGEIGPHEESYHYDNETSHTLYLYPNRTYRLTLRAGNEVLNEEFYIPHLSLEDQAVLSQSLPKTKEEADPLMTEISVPVWKQKADGTKVSSKMTVTVHSAISDRVQNVFEEIYRGKEQFPIKDLGGYSWRGGRSEHNSGTAIDLNANENFCLYRDGTTIGECWLPYENPYSVTPYGDVVNAFEKYGFTWGGDAWSNPKDYMHFSYLGT